MARLGYLGPAIVIVGTMIAGVGAWYAVHARPKPGDVIDTIELGERRQLVLRREIDGDRAFLELRDRDAVQWQALIPHYSGTRIRRGLAWGPTAVTVRIERGGRQEIFAVAMRDGRKLGGRRLAPDRDPIATPAFGPITLTDHRFSYELVGGTDWHQMIAIELATGTVAWNVELGLTPASDGGIANGRIWLMQNGNRRTFEASTGRELSLPPSGSDGSAMTAPKSS